MPKPETFTVIAGKNGPCPLPGAPKRLAPDGRRAFFVYSDKPTTVPNNRYWRRRLSLGDVVVSKPASAPKTKRATLAAPLKD